jgi:hypothetical protein
MQLMGLIRRAIECLVAMCPGQSQKALVTESWADINCYETSLKKRWFVARQSELIERPSANRI